MLPLNKDAISILRNEPDVLSEPGKIQSIWHSFIKDVDFDSSEDISLKVILKEIDGKVIKNLLFGNDNLNETIQRYHDMIEDVHRVGVSESTLMEFYDTLDNSLVEYMSIRKNKITNNKFNVGDKLLDSYCPDESKILYAMLRNQLIDPNEVQGLLDNQSLELMTTANRFMSTYCGRESSSDGSYGIQKPSPLTIEDFGTDTTKLLSCVESLVTEDIDIFPTSAPEVSKLIFPKEEFDNQVLYSQGNYMSNVANYDILSATSRYVENSFQLDNETAIYSLSSVMNQLKGFINKFDKKICLMMYMVISAFIVRRLEDNPETAGLNYAIKKELANAFSMYKLVESDKDSQLPNLIRIPQELKDFVTTANCDQPVTRLSSNNDDFPEDLDIALNDILSSIEELGATLEYYGITDNSAKQEVSLESADLSSLTVEQSDSKIRDLSPYVKLLEDNAMKFHSELNHSLLEGDFELAANQIALEIALLERLDDNQLAESATFETLQRDIFTYEDRVNHSSLGISNYLDSARSTIESICQK